MINSLTEKINLVEDELHNYKIQMLQVLPLKIRMEKLSTKNDLLAIELRQSKKTVDELCVRIEELEQAIAQYVEDLEHSQSKCKQLQAQEEESESQLKGAFIQVIDIVVFCCCPIFSSSLLNILQKHPNDSTDCLLSTLYNQPKCQNRILCWHHWN